MKEVQAMVKVIILIFQCRLVQTFNWSEAFDNSIKEIKKFKPDALVISLGVDAYEKDQLVFKLKSNNFIDIGRKLSKLGIPTLFVMEGVFHKRNWYKYC